ncbi:MAG TPA: aspartate kinase [Candidatus Limnocylindria bacterium]|nr:aspartate kinase [Candidatus Limnocylindria bacterium]
MIVAKFGGTSLADAAAFLRVRDILRADSDRRYVVVSAPGKRGPEDRKVTDLLLLCHRKAANGEDFSAEFDSVTERFGDIAAALHTQPLPRAELERIRGAVAAGASRDYVASRGEYLCARLAAQWLDMAFVDAACCVRFHPDGRLDDQETHRLLRESLLAHEYAVLPGFYGADAAGEIHTFSRGGSDVSGALAAAAVDADLYENWTDVTGFRSADPRIVPDATYISSLTYRELRELSYMGATVLHEDAIFPVRRAGIPTGIRNTFDPLHPGTTIRQAMRTQGKVPMLTGIAGKRGFSVIVIEKDRMNEEIGFGRKVLSVLERHGVNFEHLPTGIDALCVMARTAALSPARADILAEIEREVQPDTMSVQDGVALVACVGAGMFKQHGTIARLFTAVAEQGIAIRTMFQAPSELSVIIGVGEEDLERAVRALYDAFIRA